MVPVLGSALVWGRDKEEREAEREAEWGLEAEEEEDHQAGGADRRRKRLV